MKELTFGELKQALVCCTVFKDCYGCPLFDDNKLKTVSAGDTTCTQQLMAAAMNCISTMERDLADVRSLAGRWEETATAHEQTIIKLHEDIDRRAKNEKI